MKRTDHNGSLRAKDAGREVTLVGWCAKRRNLGSIVFIDLRDRSGICQVVFDETMAEKVKDVRMSFEEVHYILDVKRYVEVVRTLPVNVVNVPADKRLQVFPSSVAVTLKLSFPLAADPEEGLGAYVDYQEYAKSLSGMCKVKLSGAPKGLLSYESDPVAVGCVLEDR